jgi:hypothetical protein
MTDALDAYLATLSPQQQAEYLRRLQQEDEQRNDH